MSGLRLRQVGLVVVAGTVLAIATGAGRDSGMSLNDARKDYEAAKKKYESELTRSITKAQRDGDEKVFNELTTELSSLNVGFDVKALHGAWRFDYNNGVTRTYVFSPNGQVRYAEENKSGRAMPQKGSLVIKFAGMSEAEVVTLEPTWKLLHYNPAANIGRTPPKHTAVGTKLQ